MKNKPTDAVNDRPFAAAVLAKARKAVEDYRFAFWRTRTTTRNPYCRLRARYAARTNMRKSAKLSI